MAVRCSALLFVLLALGTGASFAAAPVITGVDIDRGLDVNSWNWVSYHQGISITITATEPETVACVIIIDPFGRQYALSVCAGGGWPDWDGWQDSLLGQLDFWTEENPDHSVSCRMYQRDMLDPPPAGVYEIRVSYNGGEEPVVLTTPAAPAIPPTRPTLIAPVSDSVIGDITPTFRWSSGTAGEDTQLVVREEGSTNPPLWDEDEGGAIWWPEVTGLTEAEFDFDGSAEKIALEAAHAYFWDIYTRAQTVAAAPVTIQTSQIVHGRFAVAGDWPATPPELSGKFAYTGLMFGEFAWDCDSEAIWLYGTDLASRSWLAPDSAANPQWSADGTQLLFYKKDLGLWIDPMDGSMPFHIPVDAWGEPSWSPDNQSVAYPLGSYGRYEIWVSDVAGLDPHPIVQFADSHLRYPDWSPNGAWIAFVRRPDSEPDGVWLVRPDGTDAHALDITGIAGYPGYEVDYVGDPAWSPDGGRLAVAFGATLGEDSLIGIGTVAPSGGALTPVFIAPSTTICCASPSTPTWSPTGTKIVFASAHHLAPDPEWANGKLETGMELWMVAARGGDPVRLTYDDVYNSYSDWWAPPTFTDVTPGFWALGAVNGCYEAGIVSGYDDGFYHPDWPVTRDQMAVYIARGLAGGEENVPAGPAEATFDDVPNTGYGASGTDPYWAYDHIEYCADQNVVQGYTATTYEPTFQVTRDQMAVYVARAMVAPTGEAALDDYVPADPRNFPDVPNTGYGEGGTDPFWAYTHIEYCVEHGVVGGYDDGYYRPEWVVTRDQMAAYVARAFGL